MLYHTLPAFSLYLLASCASLSPRSPHSKDFKVELVSGPVSQGTPQTFETTASHRALNNFKDRLGPDAIISLLAPEVTSAYSAWHSILSNSTGKRHILSEARMRAYNTAYNATSFLAWFGADTGDPHKMTGAHPEHYVEAMSLDAATGRPTVDILESWGPLVTHYRIPAYLENGPKTAWMKELKEFPFQFTGSAVLQDGTGAVVGDIHNSFRDLRADEVGWGRKGVEAVLAVWLPDGTPDDVMEGLREHQAVEFMNWLGFAQRDFESGVFVA